MMQRSCYAALKVCFCSVVGFAPSGGLHKCSGVACQYDMKAVREERIQES